jgi:hypothetical protein
MTGEHLFPHDIMHCDAEFRGEDAASAPCSLAALAVADGAGLAHKAHWAAASATMAARAAASGCFGFFTS